MDAWGTPDNKYETADVCDPSPATPLHIGNKRFAMNNGYVSLSKNECVNDRFQTMDLKHPTFKVPATCEPKRKTPKHKRDEEEEDIPADVLHNPERCIRRLIRH